MDCTCCGGTGSLAVDGREIDCEVCEGTGELWPEGHWTIAVFPDEVDESTVLARIAE